MASKLPSFVPGYVPAVAATASLSKLYRIRQKYQQKGSKPGRQALMQWMDNRIDYLKTRKLLENSNDREDTE